MGLEIPIHELVISSEVATDTVGQDLALWKKEECEETKKTSEAHQGTSALKLCGQVEEDDLRKHT